VFHKVGGCHTKKRQQSGAMASMRILALCDMFQKSPGLFRPRLVTYLFLLLKLPERLEVLGLLDDLVDGVEPSLLRTLPELEDDQLPELFVLELPVLVLGLLVLDEPLAGGVVDAEPDPLELNDPVRSVVAGFFSSVLEDDEDEDGLAVLELLYPLYGSGYFL
jgi:hypothetical protein